MGAVVHIFSFSAFLYFQFEIGMWEVSTGEDGDAKALRDGKSSRGLPIIAVVYFFGFTQLGLVGLASYNMLIFEQDLYLIRCMW